MVVQPDNFPFMVIGNKSDMETSRVVGSEQGKRAVADLGPDIDHVEASAKDNQNVTSAFMALAKKALHRQLSMQHKSDSGSSTRNKQERERLK